jgi:phage terminase large subunit
MNEIKIPKVFKSLDEPYRYKVMYGGRGSAKTWTVARKLILKGIENRLLILCTRELQKSVKQSVHRVIKEQIKIMGLDGFFDITEQSIKGKNGTEFIFLGTRYNPDEIKGTEGVDICWIEEGHNLTEASWDLIDPTIRKANSEIWITFNTRFKFDHIYQMFIANTPPPSSLVLKVNHSDNPYFNQTTMPAQMENMKLNDYEKYLHIWEGELKTLAEGAIFGAQVLKAKKDGRFCKIPIATGSKVYTFWDLGRNDHTAIWFMQNIGKEYRMIDYYENRLQDIEHYCKVLAGKLNDNEMRQCGVTKEAQDRRSGYFYGEHFMPHDVKAQSLGMKLTREQQFINGGVKPIKTVPRIAVKNDAIEMARQIFSEVWFDESNCVRGIECLSNYRYEYNDDKDTHNQSPHHDWSSNGADAFMQFAQGYTVEEQRQSLPPPRKRHRA